MPQNNPQLFRVALFILLVLLSPVAVFLCGFCCCVAVMESESLELIITFFSIGILGGALLAFYLLFLLNKKWFANHTTAVEDANHD